MPSTSCRAVALCVLIIAAWPSWCAAVTDAPGRMVDIGGRRLHLLCVGSGAPTVVFESGLGEGASAWALVQDAVGRQFRACSYDRSGIAFSDPDPAPRSAARLVNDLHELLARSGEHHVQFDKPGLVVESIVDLAKALRTTRR